MPETDWTKSKKWADRFMPEIKSILGRMFINESTMQMDAEEGTDLIVLEIRPVRIACRIRQYRYYERYPDEFTIRRRRPSGAKSEMMKIIEGFGDYYLYGFSNKEETALQAYSILDLGVFRRELILHHWKKHLKYSQQNNRDGSSDFLAFTKSSFPPDLIIRPVSKPLSIEAFPC